MVVGTTGPSGSNMVVLSPSAETEALVVDVMRVVAVLLEIPGIFVSLLAFVEK